MSNFLTLSAKNALAESTKTLVQSKLKKIKKESGTRFGDDENFYCIVLWNDDKTPMTFVVNLLLLVFSLSEERANHLMWMTHYFGSARFGRYTKQEASEKVEQSRKLARAARHPFKVSMQPIDS